MVVATRWRVGATGGRPYKELLPSLLFISDGSQFTTGGAENPTLTIVTLAIRQAEYIADQMGKNEI